MSLYSDTKFKVEVTLYAIWQAHTYTISYNLNGGTISENSSTGTFDQVVNIPYPTKDGYVFAGWTITGYELNTAQTGTSEDNLATLTEAVAETVGTKNKYFKNLTSLDINEVADEKDATITFLAQWVEVPSNAYAKDIITPAMYGDKVNYNANGVSDWKIFLNDDSNVYLISEEIVLTRGMDFGETAKKASDTNNYTVIASERDGLVKWLLDPEKKYWTNYSIGITSANATGSPTLEQFVKSYNEKYGTDFTSDTGLDIWTINNNNDLLYVPSGVSRDNAAGYWFATASSLYSGAIKDILWSGDVGSHNNSNSNFGCRPVIQLPSNLKMTWNSETQAWNIDQNQLTGAITAQNYGDSVDYSVTVKGENIDDWKIFLQEDDQIYLIAGDYVSRNCLTLDDRVIAPVDSGNTQVAGKTVSSAEWTVYQQLRDDFFEWLTDADIWKSFKDENLATDAKGGASLEEFTSSHDQKYGTSYVEQGATKWDLSDGHDYLYAPETKGNWRASACWLTTKKESFHLYVEFAGKSVQSLDYRDNYVGIRPLVKLKSNTILTKWDGEKWILGTKTN